MNRNLLPMKIFLFIIVVAGLTSCSSPIESTQTSNSDNNSSILSTEIRCPKNHSDSIIPIVYGFPTEEDFQKSDSGLVALGGCEIPENPPSWYCKIHQYRSKEFFSLP